MRRVFAFLFALSLCCQSICFAGSNASSGLTAQDFINRLRVDMHASTSVDTFFSDTEAVQWVNEAVETINGLTQCMETSEQVVLSAGTIDYSIAATHYDVSHVIYDNGIADSPHRYHWVVRLTPGLAIPPQDKLPKLWWEWESKLWIWPVPDSSVSGTTVVAYLNAKHSPITTVASAISLPSYMDTAILYYIRAKAHFKEKSQETATYYMRLFNSFINENKRIIIRRDLAPMSGPAPAEEGGK